MLSWLECQVISVRSWVQIGLPTVVLGLRCHRNLGNAKIIFLPKKSGKWKFIFFLIFLWIDQQKPINNPLLKCDRAKATETTTTTNDSLLILCWSGHSFSSACAMQQVRCRKIWVAYLFIRKKIHLKRMDTPICWPILCINQKHSHE